NVAYLADAFDEPLTGEAADARVHDDVLTWLADAAGGLWPKTARPFPWDMLHDPAGRTGAERLEAQYWRANTDGSSQYVTGAPNTTALRLDPHGTQFSNLFLAGDWVKTPLNAGSVEGAAMGGRLAGQRIAEHFVSEGHAGVPGSQYIERDGDLPLLQPVVLGAARMHGYVLKADQDALERTLAATFSPLGITCTPLLPIVVVTSVQVDEIRSQLRPNDGYMTEAELGFWLPVAMKWNGGSSRGLYLPYLFVDNPAAMLAGREIYGFNKILAQFRYRASGDIDPVEIKAQVLHTRAAQTRLDWQPVVSIATERPNETSLWHSSGELISSVVGKIVDQFPGAVLGNALSLPSAPVFFLKQLRAAGQGARTCMQQAITARVSVAPGTVSGGWLPPFGVELSFTAHATLDIATTLGLKPTAKPWLAFWASCSATLEAGQVLGGNAGVDE
ncbi:MAG TPA: acetoacetate decarboxylase family protein, partial [Kofleriaceae bacterium]